MRRRSTGVQSFVLRCGARCHRLQRRIAPCLAVLVVMGTLTVLGCGGDDGGGSSRFTAATATDLTNRTFTFTAEAGPNLAAMLGLPAGQAFALQIGNFGGTTMAPVQLDSGGNTASGTVTIGSCIFRFDRSTFPAGSGPQANAPPITIDTCEVDRDNRTLRLATSGGESAVSSTANLLPTTNVAFVLTTDFSSGSYSIVDLASRNVFSDIRRGGVDSDATPARFLNGRVYVVNRGANSIQIIDPQQGFTTPTNGELSTGSGTNPQDIVFVSATKAYVSRLASARLLTINPTTLVRLGELDLSGLVQANDGDRSPEPAHMLVHRGLVYVVLQHLDFSRPVNGIPIKVARGEIAVIDPTNDTIRGVIQLNGQNPVSELQFSATLNRLLISSVGDFAVRDGGIETINPDTNAVDPRFALSEEAAGGDLTAFAIVSRTKGFAVVSDANFANSLVTFDPSTGQLLRRIVGPLNVFVPHLAINSRNEVYLAVADTRTATPGLRIFDTVTDRELTTTPLRVGQLPPQFTLFIE